jgi:hypothetical protein
VDFYLLLGVCQGKNSTLVHAMKNSKNHQMLFAAANLV